MAITEKVYSINILENGPTGDNLIGIPLSAPIVNYSTSSLTFLIDDGVVQITVDGAFPQFASAPSTLEELVANQSAGSIFVNGYSGSLGPSWTGDNPPSGTLLIEQSSDTPYAFSMMLDPLTLERAKEIYSGDDLFYGSTSPDISDDRVFGFGGDDTFYTYGTGDRYDKVYGGDGIDTAVYEAPRGYFEIFPAPERIYNVLTDARDLDGFSVVDRTGDESGDQLVDVERLRFTDTNVALDFERGQNGFKAAALITTIFGSDYIPSYFAPAVGLVDDGMANDQIAQLVIDLGLISTASNETFVETIYENVIGMAPDSLTRAIYADQLSSGDISHAELISLGANVPLIENQMDDLGDWRISGLEYLGF